MGVAMDLNDKNKIPNKDETKEVAKMLVAVSFIASIMLFVVAYIASMFLPDDKAYLDKIFYAVAVLHLGFATLMLSEYRKSGAVLKNKILYMVYLFVAFILTALCILFFLG